MAWLVPSVSYSGSTQLVITGALGLLTAQRKSMGQAVATRLDNSEDNIDNTNTGHVGNIHGLFRYCYQSS